MSAEGAPSVGFFRGAQHGILAHLYGSFHIIVWESWPAHACLACPRPSPQPSPAGRGRIGDSESYLPSLIARGKGASQLQTWMALWA